MGWIDALRGRVVSLDTAPVIYYIERRSDYVEVLRPFFQALDNGALMAVTSVITLLEVLVHPIRLGNTRLAHQYRDILFNSTGLKTLAFSPEIAEEAAMLRAFHNIRTPDSIQVATAINAGASHFLTNDTHLPSLSNLQILTVEAIRAEESI